MDRQERRHHSTEPTDRWDVPEEENLLATSNENGEFQFSGLAPGRYRIEAHAPGYMTAVLPSMPVPFEGRVTLLMMRAGQLEGTVLSADGQPAAGAQVLATFEEQDSTTQTDDEGRFSLDVPPGRYSLSARRGEETGTLDQWVSVTAGQRVQGLLLQLSAEASVTGHDAGDSRLSSSLDDRANHRCDHGRADTADPGHSSPPGSPGGRPERPLRLA
ncbi:carboxypeptidase-like regulatory domain-containing protein [Hyalangium versicolor]|uniref:carboxypeptidase-like regulatory domain-containing protein n=1 Tax=Hyalangium versicolor TaxID=2861190 RepID=UPI001CCD40EF|nr:carboxypeptidase-like regulatory domain-containing protein [Hyalangium versicolor]